jgi:Raf kinase inhibitor-like YbhB/YbcL family protein
MKLLSDSILDGGNIADRFAFGKPHPDTHFTFSDNVSPHLAWTDAPANTASFVVICHDSDVPSVGDDVNKEGRSVPHDLPRVDFFHWVLIDVPASVCSLAEGDHAAGVVTRGKPAGPAPVGTQGLNDFTGWFAGHPDMGGQYAGYDGPAPPWNDTRLHHYHFTVYALSVARLPVAPGFGGADVQRAMTGHVLAQASIQGTYTMNPDLRG